MRSLQILTAFLIGFLVAGAGGYFLDHLKDAQRQGNLLSDVHDPLLTAIEDIDATLERGQIDLAREKVELLHQGWEAYLFHQGKVPEQFVPEITAMVVPAPD